ncbi:MAG: response regulator transcription factor [Candidatus Krumholzibacteriaceae bacterium]|jgi:two-component system nitrate/nitrite response regulator NarL
MRTKKRSSVAKIRILLIEDNRLLRDGIAAMLNKHGEFRVVARSEDADSVRQLKKMPPPDVILLDLGLEKEDSLKLMSLLREESSEAKVIAMDILPDHVDIIEFVKAGGCGFILKNAPLEDWIRTIKTVAAGQKVLPPCLTQSLFAQMIEGTLKSGKGIPAKSIQFTNREREIVALISEGLSNKEIAERLHIATFTAKSHVHNILEKMALSTRLQIAVSVRKDES